ncbi:hypothetical protein TNCV_269911 [Trichonephila clavipes]|nr:hypothetical protein TNCV_269911 [Trichonephila clavipes]
MRYLDCLQSSILFCDVLCVAALVGRRGRLRKWRSNRSGENQLLWEVALIGEWKNITARVIERNVKGEIHYFLEESRGFRTHQHGRPKRCQLGSTDKISPRSH